MKRAKLHAAQLLLDRFEHKLFVFSQPLGQRKSLIFSVTLVGRSFRKVCCHRLSHSWWSWRHGVHLPATSHALHLIIEVIDYVIRSLKLLSNHLV